MVKQGKKVVTPVLVAELGDIIPNSMPRSRTAAHVTAAEDIVHYPLHYPIDPNTGQSNSRTCRVLGCINWCAFVCDMGHISLCLAATDGTSFFKDFDTNFRRGSIS